jgi:hypothetical protein
MYSLHVFVAQLPTEKQLKHKQEAPQSFENDFKQSNTRAISLFIL